MPEGIEVQVEGDQVVVTRSSDLPFDRALHGTARVMINNMIKGVTEGFSKQLEIEGIGYKAQVQGNKLTLNLCYSHPVVYEAREGITIEVPDPRKISVIGSGPGSGRADRRRDQDDSSARAVQGQGHQVRR